MSASELRISVVMPACNAHGYLHRCLGALRAQEVPPLEIIVIDDGSRDDTPQLAEELGARVIRLGGNSGPSHARNVGAREAQGEILYFVDADVAVHPDAVRRVRDFFAANAGVAALFGSYDDAPLAKGLLTEYRNLLHHYTHQHGRREASTFWSGCGAVRREVFLALGGYDEVDYPRSIEDIELGYRLRAAGHRIVLDPQLFGKHMKRWTLWNTIVTDVMGRAIPWTRLNARRQNAPDDLNIKKSQKLSVALTGLGLLSIPAALLTPWTLLTVPVAVLLIVALNAPWFGFLAAKRGLLFAAGCVPLHLLYFAYSGASFAYARLAMALGLPLRDGNSPPRS